MRYLYFFLFFLIFLLNCQKTFSKIEIEAPYVILQDHLSGNILYEKNSKTRIYPASMTKIMTTIIVFDLLKKGETSLDEMITISEKAWRMSQSGYSSMFIVANDKVSVEDLLKGIIIVSGNDACLALAEGLSGTEEDFVILMNEKSRDIGLKNTNFANSSGINDPNNYSTVEDILKLSRYMIENYPEYYPYYKVTAFTWDRTGGDPITQNNRNTLLFRDIGVDGIKTGFLTVEKYSLAASIKDGERRITSVVSGFKTKRARTRESTKLLTWGLRRFDTVKVAGKNEIIAKLNVWHGKKNKIETHVNEDIYLTVPKRKKKTIKAVVEYNSPVRAPIKKGEKLGVLNIYASNQLKKKVDIFSSEEIKRTNIFSRLFKSLNFLVWGDV
jgi:D-alanyl-D-alanine carboxypeptidase (penicillin-binding protein 5/6)|tara:strand:+ start:1631 stop:2785 length:1155 start_codon:yes stop_codon:yes gene_type:complete